VKASRPLKVGLSCRIGRPSQSAVVVMTTGVESEAKRCCTVRLAVPASTAGVKYSATTAVPVRLLVWPSRKCNEYLVHVIGATGYHALVFSADESLSSLGQVIERVRQGARFISSRLARCQAALWAAPASFPKLLSKREQEVLVCIAHALSDEEIARQLGFAPGTALSHRRRLMSKLGIHSTPKLIRYCADKGFNSVPPPGPPLRDRRT
jgi:DNA-binding CsgD family transcriptional regulator